MTIKIHKKSDGIINKIMSEIIKETSSTYEEIISELDDLNKEISNSK